MTWHIPINLQNKPIVVDSLTQHKASVIQIVSFRAVAAFRKQLQFNILHGPSD